MHLERLAAEGRAAAVEPRATAWRRRPTWLSSHKRVQCSATHSTGTQVHAGSNAPHGRAHHSGDHPRHRHPGRWI
jgi:hypothetical protein